MDFPVTFQCNNDCISCIFDTRQMKLMQDPLPESLQEFIGEQKDEECIAFTGGEPTLSKHLFKLLKYTRQKWPEKHIFLVSNGRKFSEKNYARELAELKLGNFKVGIPIFSHNPAIHDEITRAKGSFDETIKGIENLIKLGVEVELRIIVNKMNYQEMSKTAEFIAKNLKGILRVVFINMKYTGNAFINRKKLFVRYSKLAPFVEKAANALIEKGFEVKLFHFPLCIIQEKYWNLAAGITKQENELVYSKNCRGCTVKDICPRIWISYLPLAGEKEFKAISKE